MATVRHITAKELEAFTLTATDPARAKRQANTLEIMWKKGDSKPEWCFVLEHDGKMVGRLMYWAAGHARDEVKLMGIQLPWGGNWEAMGKMLLERSLSHMKKGGARQVMAYLISDSDLFNANRKELIVKAGFDLAQKKVRFQIDLEDKSPAPGARLQFRSLSEVGDETFVEAIGQVTEGTLDQLDAEGYKEVGQETAAQNYFAILKNVHFEPDWWLLAYNGAGELAGLVVPQQFGKDRGVLNYVGVPPKHRGRGYVNDLLAKGLSVLKENGIRHILADTDAKNFPIHAALQKASFIHSHTLNLYRKDL